MLQWLPKLSVPDLCVLALTVGLCIGASRIWDFGDFLGRLFGADKKS